jgi:hypothetical protein
MKTASKFLRLSAWPALNFVSCVGVARSYATAGAGLLLDDELVPELASDTRREVNLPLLHTSYAN